MSEKNTSDALTAATYCAICFNEFSMSKATTNGEDRNTIDSAVRAVIPCCERETSSTKFCIHCLKHLCEKSSDGHNRARCPRCQQSYITVDSEIDNGNEILKVKVVPNPPKECMLCKQHFAHNKLEQIRPNVFLCTSCHFGILLIRYPLRYTCQNCYNVQYISHPMYRYQPSHDQYSTATWACHQNCQTYTHWRIVPNDVYRIPRDDVPNTWDINYGNDESELNETGNNEVDYNPYRMENETYWQLLRRVQGEQRNRANRIASGEFQRRFFGIAFIPTICVITTSVLMYSALSTVLNGK